MRRSTTLTLLHREWRSARGIFLLAAVLLVIGGCAFSLFAPDGEAEAALIGLAGFTAIIVTLAVAADVVARDRSHGTLDSLALLPASLTRIWVVKAAFVLLTALVAGEVSFLVPRLIATLLRPALQDAIVVQFEGFDGTTLGLTPLLPVGAAIALLYSTLVERGLVALLLTGVTAGLVAMAGFPAHRYLEMMGAEPLLGEIPDWLILAGVTGSFGLGSWIAFTRGPIHIAGAGRRWAVGFAVPLLTLAIPVVHLATVLLAFEGAAPGDPEITFDRIALSPDGRTLAVTAYRRERMPGVWLLDIETGGARRVGGVATLPARPWRDDGRLAMIRFPTLIRALQDEPEGAYLEPDGTTLSPRPLSGIPEWAWPEPLPEVERRSLRARPGHLRHSISWGSGPARKVMAVDTEPGGGLVAFSPGRELLVYWKNASTLVRRKRGDREGTVLLEVPAPGHLAIRYTGGMGSLRGDGRALVVRVGEDLWHVLDPDTGTALMEPFRLPSKQPQRVYPIWLPTAADTPYLWILRWDDGPGEGREGLIDTRTGASVPGFQGRRTAAGAIAALPDGGFVLVDDRTELIRLDKEGRRATTLYPAEPGE